MIEEYFYDLIQQEIIIDNNNNCDHDLRKDISHYVCILCGHVDIDKPILVDSTIKYALKEYHSYKRRLYFTERLRLMCCYKSCNTEEYKNVVNELKSYQFNEIYELKLLLKKLRWTHYYKHIYNIYYDLKNVVLVPLRHEQISFLERKFIKYEKCFTIDKSMVAYGIIIYCFFKLYNFAYYQYIMLPKNSKRIIEIIYDLLKNIENY